MAMSVIVRLMLLVANTSLHFGSLALTLLGLLRVVLSILVSLLFYSAVLQVGRWGGVRERWRRGHFAAAAAPSWPPSLHRLWAASEVPGRYPS